MIVSTSLLLVYIAAFCAFQVDLGPRILQAWKRARGKSTEEEKHLLHTLPYYLAITRSSCEVIIQLQDHICNCYSVCILMCWKIVILLKELQYEAQAHILNLPVGHTIHTAAKNSVKLDGVKLKFGDKKTNWKSVVGLINLCWFTLSWYSQLMKFALPGLLTVLIVAFFAVFLVTNISQAGWTDFIQCYPFNPNTSIFPFLYFFIIFPCFI